MSKDFEMNVTNEFEQTSVWENPTPETIKFKLFVKHGHATVTHNGIANASPPKWIPVVIPPGGKTTIPSMYDNSIRRVRRNTIVAGLAPQLKKVNGPNYKLSKNIDPSLATEAARLAEANKILEAKAAADRALTIATAEMVKREEELTKKRGK